MHQPLARHEQMERDGSGGGGGGCVGTRARGARNADPVDARGALSSRGSWEFRPPPSALVSPTPRSVQGGYGGDGDGEVVSAGGAEALGHIYSFLPPLACGSLQSGPGSPEPSTWGAAQAPVT